MPAAPLAPQAQALAPQLLPSQPHAPKEAELEQAVPRWPAVGRQPPLARQLTWWRTEAAPPLSVRPQVIQPEHVRPKPMPQAPVRLGARPGWAKAGAARPRPRPTHASGQFPRQHPQPPRRPPPPHATFQPMLVRPKAHSAVPARHVARCAAAPSRRFSTPERFQCRTSRSRPSPPARSACLSTPAARQRRISQGAFQQRLAQSKCNPSSVPSATTQLKRSSDGNENATSNGTPFLTRYRQSIRSGCWLSFPGWRSPMPKAQPPKAHRPRRRCRRRPTEPPRPPTGPQSPAREQARHRSR